MDDIPADDFFEPTRLAQFTNSLAFLQPMEKTRAKQLYFANALTAFEEARAKGRITLVILGIASIFVVPLIFFVPAVIVYCTNMKSLRRKLLNMLELWKEDLSAEYAECQTRIK